MMKKHIPISVVWETTLACNMNCIHCGSSAGKRRVKELSTDESMKVLDDLKTLGTRVVSMMGGEPFLRRDWEDIALYIRDLNMNLTFMSNGLLIDDEIIAKLKNIDPYAVTISLDGATADIHNAIRGVNNSFDGCIKSLDLLTEAGLPTTVITTLHKKNINDLKRIRDLLLNRGIAWQIQMAVPIGRFPQNLMLSKKEYYSAALFIAATKKKYSIKELPVLGAHNFGYHSQILPNLMLLPWIGCQAGLTALGIQSNGGVKGCLSLPDKFIEGNVRTRSLIDIWEDPNSFLYNRSFKLDDLENQCMDCVYGKTCRGGCVTVSSSLTGEDHCNPYCLKLIEEKMLK